MRFDMAEEGVLLTNTEAKKAESAKMLKCDKISAKYQLSTREEKWN